MRACLSQPLAFALAISLPTLAAADTIYEFRSTSGTVEGMAPYAGTLVVDVEFASPPATTSAGWTTDALSDIVSITMYGVPNALGVLGSQPLEFLPLGGVYSGPQIVGSTTGASFDIGAIWATNTVSTQVILGGDNIDIVEPNSAKVALVYYFTGTGFNAVPEPSSVALMGLGMAGAGALSWRRRPRAVFVCVSLDL